MLSWTHDTTHWDTEQQHKVKKKKLLSIYFRKTDFTKQEEAIFKYFLP